MTLDPGLPEGSSAPSFGWIGRSQDLSSDLRLEQYFWSRKALYAGLKSADAAFCLFLADTLMDMGYKSTKADPDVWIRQAVKSDCFELYEMVLCYVDDILSISNDPKLTLLALTSTFKLKDDKIEPPDIYLGAQLGIMPVDNNNVECWTMTAEKYYISAVKNVKEALARKGLQLPTKCYTLISTDYRPELEVSPELKSNGIQLYQELIWVLRWAIELGRVDIFSGGVFDVDSHGHAKGRTPSSDISNVWLLPRALPKEKACIRFPKPNHQ